MGRKRFTIIKIFVLITLIVFFSIILIYVGIGRMLVSLGEKLIYAGKYTERVEEKIKKKGSIIEKKAEGLIEKTKEVGEEIKKKAD